MGILSRVMRSMRNDVQQQRLAYEQMVQQMQAKQMQQQVQTRQSAPAQPPAPAPQAMPQPDQRGSRGLFSKLASVPRIVGNMIQPQRINIGQGQPMSLRQIDEQRMQQGDLSAMPPMNQYRQY